VEVGGYHELFPMRLVGHVNDVHQTSETFQRVLEKLWLDVLPGSSNDSQS